MSELANLSADEVRRRVMRIRDDAAFCREALNIRNEQGQKVPLELQPAQLKLLRLERKCERLGKPLWFIYLKARQVRASTAVAKTIWRRIAFWPGQTGMCVGDTYRSAKSLWGYYHQFDDSYRAFEGLMKLRTLRSIEPTQTTAGFIKWEQDSELETASANSVTAGRSKPIRHLQLSEYAFYRDAATLMTGIMASIPKDLYTTLAIESTPNGVGNPYYDEWMRAIEGKSELEAIFFGWHEEPKYTRVLPCDPAEFQRSLTDEEWAEKQKYSLNLEQLCWRRYAINTLCEGSMDRFHQEYPGCPEEAFLASGRPFFDMGAVGRMARQEPVDTGDLAEIHVGPQRRWTVRHNENGRLRLFRHPQAGHYYCIGADIGNGRQTNDDGRNLKPDWSAAQILDVDTAEEVALFEQEDAIPDDFAATVASLGEWYNEAFLTPERNSFGEVVVLWLMRNNYPLDKVYATGRVPGDKRPPEYHQLGYLTNRVTRPALIGQLQGAVAAGSIIVHDPHTIHQLRTFVWLNGKPQAQPGSKDDLVLSLALAWEGLRFAPRAETQWQVRRAHASYGTQYGKSEKKGPEYE